MPAARGPTTTGHAIAAKFSFSTKRPAPPR
jgi:hypothetical protein